MLVRICSQLTMLFSPEDSVFLWNVGVYTQRKRSWPLKSLNWNLEASHLPAVCLKGGGNGTGLIVSFLFFLHSVVHILGPPNKISAKNV
jgi:hypothetical protein